MQNQIKYMNKAIMKDRQIDEKSESLESRID